MTLPSVFVGVLVLAGGLSPQPQTAAAPTPGELRWVRGVVTAVSPDSLTLTLRDKALTLSLDPTTEVVGSSLADTATGAPAGRLTVGSRVEAHYTDRKAVRRAVLIVDNIPDGSVPLSKRPGKSYRGIIRELKRSSLSMLVGTRKRSVDLDSHTKLTGTDGRSLAIGKKAIASQVSAGEEVLVTYDEGSDTMLIGDVPMTFDSRKALEIRKLRPAAPLRAARSHPEVVGGFR